jgi:DNA-binding NarL/FixJ family response regulator
MKVITAALESTRPLVREVLHYLVTRAGMKVVGEFSDSLDLLCSIGRLRPEVIFLWTADGLKEPGICSHLLQEYPHLKVVVVSPEHYAISDVGVRARRFSDFSRDSLRTSLLESFAS